jgi:hypothetical protein
VADNLLASRLKNLKPEQIRADIGRWKREIQNERTRHGLTDDHPNISRRLARIRVAEQLLGVGPGQGTTDSETNLSGGHRADS